MSTSEIRKEQTDGVVPYTGADQAIDLGSQNLTTMGTIYASIFAGGTGGGGGGAVDSVNGETGAVVLDTDDIGEGATNLYFTNERSQDAVGAMVASTASIKMTYTDGTPELSATIQTGSVLNTMLAGGIAASKLVGTDITTVGTVTTGTWNATTIATARGGTGNTTFTSNRLITGNGGGALSTIALGTNGQILGMNPGATANEYKTVSFGTSGNDLNIGSTTGVMTLNVPNAGSSVRGVIPGSGSTTLSPTITFENIPILPGTDPTLGNQAARKAYVDVIGQMVDPSLYKNACDIATTGNITLSGEQIIDNFQTSATRVLVWQQTSLPENGIYVSSSGAWTRAADYNTAGEVLQGSSTFILDGQININRLFVMNAASVSVLGVDDITFTPLAGLSSYNFATGTSGTDFNVNVNGSNITYNLPTATSSVRGALSASDWQSFNSKLTASGTPSTSVLAMFLNNTGTVQNSGIAVTSSGANKSITVAPGGTLTLQGANSGVGVAFDVNVTGANAATNGGGITITGGNTTGTTTTGGQVTVRAGNATSLGATGGNLDLLAGYNTATVGAQPSYIRINGLTTSASGGQIDLVSLGLSPAVRILNTGGVGVVLDASSIVSMRNYTLPDASGTLAISASNGISLDANGNLTLTSSPNPSVDVQIFTSSGTWTKPSGDYKETFVYLIGGGGGGGAGRKGATGTLRTGGGGGGPGGGAQFTFLTSILGATETVTIGVGGGGASVISANSTSGGSGSSGTSTTFGTWLRAGIGGGGAGGSSVAGAAGGSPGTFFPPPGTAGNQGGGSSGTGGSGVSTSVSMGGPNGGAGGGGITTANVANTGGFGGFVGASGLTSGYGTSINGGSSGAVGTAGGNGANAPTNSGIGGAGGGGGGASSAAAAGSGGNGGYPGGGGGGGGAAVNGVGNSGGGGSGANGFALIISK